MKKTLRRFVWVMLLFSLGFSVQGQQLVPVERIAKGKLKAPELNELSGLVASKVNPGAFWAHNDSGDEARLFLLDSVGGLLQIVNLEGLVAIDMEDIARVDRDGKSYIVLADIGDNRALRKDIKLYVFEEPQWNKSAKRKIVIPQSKYEVIKLNYYGKARDAEAAFIDPRDQQFYLISKREFQSTLYSAAIFNGKKEHQLKPLLKLPFTFAVAADISSQGDAVLVKNLTQVFYWPREQGQSIAESLSKPFYQLEYQTEPQGEAICFDSQGQSFFTVSERPFGLDAYLYQYKFSKPSTK